MNERNATASCVNRVTSGISPSAEWMARYRQHVPSHSYEITARSSASPEHVFQLLADATTWPTWGGRMIGHASWEREGTPPPGGVGAIRKVGSWPIFGHEQVVASEPPTHHAYTMVKGNPVKNYRADVYLKEENGGTTITWNASFDPKIPGTGGLLAAFYKRFIGALARKLAKFAASDYAPIVFDVDIPLDTNICS